MTNKGQSLFDRKHQFDICQYRKKSVPLPRNIGIDMTIRHAILSDIPAMMKVFAVARQFMAMTGNPHQWAEDYPNEEWLTKDINEGDSYVCVENGEVVATFVLKGGEDPTYKEIYDGQWLNDEPYATIHRIASNGQVHGVLHAAVTFALERYQNVRIDTHRDNRVMLRALDKEGFRYCGIIRCWSGEERRAFLKFTVQHC